MKSLAKFLNQSLTRQIGFEKTQTVQKNSVQDSQERTFRDSDSLINPLYTLKFLARHYLTFDFFILSLIKISVFKSEKYSIAVSHKVKIFTKNFQTFQQITQLQNIRLVSHQKFYVKCFIGNFLIFKYLLKVQKIFIKKQGIYFKQTSDYQSKKEYYGKLFVLLCQQSMMRCREMILIISSLFMQMKLLFHSTLSQIQDQNKKYDNIEVYEKSIKVYTSAIQAEIREDVVNETYVTYPRLIKQQQYIEFLEKLRTKYEKIEIVLFFDNLSFHKTKETKKSYERLNMTQVFDVPYSLNLIEQSFIGVQGSLTIRKYCQIH